QVGNVDPGDVAAAGLRRFERSVLQHDQVDQLAEFGVLRVFPEQGSILAWAGAAVEVLVRKRNEAFVEKRIPLPRHLHPTSAVWVIIVLEDSNLPATGRGVNANHLLITTQFTYRDGQFHQVNVKASLGIFARRPELQQIEHGLDVRIKTVVALTGKGDIPVGQGRDGLPRVFIELRFGGNTVPRRVLAV